MTSPRRPGRPLRPLTRVGAWLLAVLAAVGLLVFSAGAASAHTLPDGGNRVRASAPETITAVGVSEHITAGQGRGPPLSQPRIVVATGVAADSATMDSFLESGATVRHSGTATAIGDDANTIQNFARSRGAAGHDVIVHGDAEGNFRVNGMITHPNQIAEAIYSNPGYGGGSIQLVTCHGACGAAQELQDIMGVPVIASPLRVDINPVSGLLREWP